jgi:F-type H+-transporting ATPase subunit b
MLIDWFTVGAQIVNFLILMVLLKIFLYERVIHAMDEREAKIAARFEEAEQKRQKADERQETLAAEKTELEDKREEILSEARQQALSKKQALEDEARAEVDDMRRGWIEALDGDKAALAHSLREDAARQVFDGMRRAVEAMADDDFQDRLVQVFMGRVRQMDDAEKQQLTRALESGHPTAQLLCDAAVSESNRQKLTEVLRQEINADLAVDYGTAEAFIGGIELRLPGKKIAWHVHDYLEGLEEAVMTRLEAEMPRRDQATAAATEDEASEAQQSHPEEETA